MHSPLALEGDTSASTAASARGLAAEGPGDRNPQRQDRADQWQRYLSLTIPSRFEFLTSPEVLVFNGVSYFAIVAALRLEPKGPLKHWPAGMSEIWIGGIDPANPFFRRVDDPTHDVLRTEPEFLVLEGGVPILYYSEQGDTTLLFRAATGLGQ
jgi:hypothetical protein